MATKEYLLDIYKNLNSKAVTDNHIGNLYASPKKDTLPEKTRFEPVPPNNHHQIDLLYLPNDAGYKYALVVVDIGTRKMDAIQLKNKESKDVIKSLTELYNTSKYINKPKRITVDDGSEFKGVFADTIRKMKVDLRVAQTARHRQTCLAEHANGTIGAMIHRFQVGVENKTGHAYSKWIEYLSDIVEIMNSHAKPPKDNINKEAPYFGNNILLEGTKVRVLLEHPINYLSKKRLHGDFRKSDIRWDDTVRTVERAIVRNGQPILYEISGKNHVWYSRNQLQVIPSNEKIKDIDNVENDNNFEIEKIINHEKRDNIMYFKVKWKGYSAKYDTWEKRSALFKDVPQMVTNYEKSHKL